jgi:hypothetical protein
MRHGHGAPHALVLALPILLAGCAPSKGTVAMAFPQASAAAPWVLEGQVWSGSFTDAGAALGPDALEWRPFGPQRVWLAVYRHESEAQRKLTARAFSFETPAAARSAWEAMRPVRAKSFRAGDEGCWTEIGVMFVWGRLVFDIFGQQPSLPSEVAAASLTGYIQHNLRPGLADAPQ